MFYYIKGILEREEDNFAVVDVGGIGYKIYTAAGHNVTPGEEVIFFTYLHVREEVLDVYGFTSQFELEVFKKLISISGVGPKSALSVLNIAGAKELVAAINEGDAEILKRVSGIGKKTAERVVLELKDKIEAKSEEGTIKRMEADIDVEEALVSLGYNKSQARTAIQKIDSDIKGFQERLKAALKIVR